jgi:hypothetical protein
MEEPIMSKPNKATRAKARRLIGGRCCVALRDSEVRLIILLSKGSTYVQAAKSMKISKGRVYQIKKGLEARIARYDRGKNQGRLLP